MTSLTTNYDGICFRWKKLRTLQKSIMPEPKKYGSNNWQNLDNGFERYRAAMFRHLMGYMKGERVDSDTGCFHLAQCAWNCIAMLWYDKHGKGLIPLNKEEKK